ncbi:putative glutathione S-transferase GSTU6 [Hordeum vulgare]|nr:putative glutathione S-transferase GSTU6 [Hordeum vulgare]
MRSVRRCQRFEMHKIIFDRLYQSVRSYDDYFILKNGFVERIGFSSYQKCTTAHRCLHMARPMIRWSNTYGCPRAHAEIPRSDLQLSWSRCLDISIRENQLWRTSKGTWQSQKQEGVWGMKEEEEA